ncbi:MAG TPA: hypothetical protein VKA10_00280, partial [Prolixibacteraceae bacterium]|nr:hypothetical protein [Prolixibacteraceae bacterium]
DLFFEVVKEDGVAEYLTTLFLFGCTVIFAIRSVRSLKKGNKKFLLFNFLMFLLFVFGTGEEISWGQRLLGTETGEFFQEYNYQGETNLRNLELWGINLNKLLFSRLMFVALLFYFLIVPLLVLKSEKVRLLIIRFDAPLARLHHTIAFFAMNILILTINLIKEDELHELSLGAILFLILLSPATKIRGLAVRKTRLG